MRSTVVSFLFATATIAAPILEGALPTSVLDITSSIPSTTIVPDLTTSLPDLTTSSLLDLPTDVPDLDATKDLDITKDLDLDELTDILSDLPLRRGLLSGLDVTKVVPVSTSDLPLDTSDLPIDTSSLPVDTSDLPLDTSTVTSVLSDLPVRRGLLSGLDLTKIVPVDTSDLPLDTSNLPLDTSDLPLDTTDLPLSKRLLGLDSTLTTVNDLLTDILSLTSEIEADLLSLIGHLEDVDVQGVLNDVYSIVNAVLAKVKAIAAAEGVNLDTSSLQPIVTTLTSELNSLAAEVQDLIDAGVVGNLIDEIKSVLDDVITLVENTLGENDI